MWIYSATSYVLPLPPGHRFPMPKYAALRQRVRRSPPDRMRVPEPATDAELVPRARRDYVADVVERHARRRGAAAHRLPMVARDGGALAPLRRRDARGVPRAHSRTGAASISPAARITRIATRGKGFCVFNDAAVAIRALQAERGLERALVVDLDVHQGDGTAGDLGRRLQSCSPARCTAAAIFRSARRRRDLDVELDDGTGDAAYLAALRAAPRRCARPLPARTSRSISPAPTRSSAIASAASR